MQKRPPKKVEFVCFELFGGFCRREFLRIEVPSVVCVTVVWHACTCQQNVNSFNASMPVTVFNVDTCCVMCACACLPNITFMYVLQVCARSFMCAFHMSLYVCTCFCVFLTHSTMRIWLTGLREETDIAAGRSGGNLAHRALSDPWAARWHFVGPCGTLWDLVGPCGILWDLVGPYRTLWGRVWVTTGHCGMPMVIGLPCRVVDNSIQMSDRRPPCTLHTSRMWNNCGGFECCLWQYWWFNSCKWFWPISRNEKYFPNGNFPQGKVPLCLEPETTASLQLHTVKGRISFQILDFLLTYYSLRMQAAHARKVSPTVHACVWLTVYVCGNLSLRTPT